MSVKTRRVTKLQDFADTLTSIGGGWRTTFVYLNCVPFRKTGQSVNMDKLSSAMDDTMNPEISNKFKDFIGKGNKRNNRFPFAGIIKVAKYSVNWQTARKHREHYDDFVNKSDEIAAKYAAKALNRQGLPLTQDALDSVQIKSRAQRGYEKRELTGAAPKPRKDARRFVDYGKGGMYIRTNDFNKNGENRVVIPQNLKVVNIGEEHYYLINDDGNIAGGGPVSKEVIMNFVNKKDYDKSKANALRKLGANEEEIKSYLEEFANLKWDEHDFMADNFIYAVASCTSDYHDGMPEKVVFFNEDLIDEITTSEHNFKINPNEFIEIAKKEINSTYGITLEGKRYLKKNINKMIRESYYRHQKKRYMLESYIRKLVKRSLYENRTIK